MIQQALIKRRTSEIVLGQLIEDAQQILEADCVTPALKKVQEGLDATVADCKHANVKYLEEIN